MGLHVRLQLDAELEVCVCGKALRLLLLLLVRRLFHCCCAAAGPVAIAWHVGGRL